MKEETRTTPIAFRDDDQVYEVFRDRLEALLKSNGIMKKDLAKQVGISPASLSRYFTMNRDPELRYIMRIATVLGVSIDWLLGLSDEMEHPYPKETTEFAELYALANDSDRQVIQLVLSKYRGD